MYGILAARYFDRYPKDTPFRGFYGGDAAGFSGLACCAARIDRASNAFDQIVLEIRL